MDKKYTYFEYINVKEFEQNVKHIKSQDVLHNFEYQFFFKILFVFFNLYYEQNGMAFSNQ